MICWTGRPFTYESVATSLNDFYAVGYFSSRSSLCNRETRSGRSNAIRIFCRHRYLSIMRFALHTRASDGVKRPLRNQLQPNLYRERVGGCSHRSQAPYHPSCSFDACFAAFFIETNTELYVICLIAKNDMPFA